jgi:hypothetical protein
MAEMAGHLGADASFFRSMLRLGEVIGSSRIQDDNTFDYTGF